MKDIIYRRIEEHKTAVDNILKDSRVVDIITEMAEEIVNSLKEGGQLFICGNGGSAADSQHLATELISKFYRERKAINAEALSVNTSTITAIGNDYSFDNVFSRQLEAKGRYNDILLGISTSGNSKNVLMAMREAKRKGLKCFAFTGANICELDNVCDVILHVPSYDTPRIQEIHILAGHIMCELIEEAML